MRERGETPDLFDQVVGDLRRRPLPPNRGVERALAGLARDRRQTRLVWVAAAATVVLAAGLGWRTLRPGGMEVHFEVRAPASRTVALAGDFNGWNAESAPLVRHGAAWSVTLRLPPGRYRYAYLVDGKHWVADPVQATQDEDFDTPTSVITVAN